MRKVHTRLMNVSLALEESRAYWENVPPKEDQRTMPPEGDQLTIRPEIAPDRLPLAAFEQRWFGNKSLTRVRRLLRTFDSRFGAFPRALAVLRRWRPRDPATRRNVCHWHTQLSDPLYRAFTSDFLEQRRCLRDPSVDPDVTARWIDRRTAGKWAPSARRRMGLVAEHELKLELDGGLKALEAKAEEVLGMPWSDANQDELAEEHFSELMHALNPERYIEPMSWFDSHVGMATGAGSSVEETTRDVARMLEQRAPGKTLFLVVDEVSQYIHHNESRMLKLQSFVSDLGQKLKGRVWLLATGQQKLEDSEDESNIGKLKDRFPPRLRVHLAPTNIRDVVHKRLLKKDPAKVQVLRDLFQQHRPDLKLYGYAGDSITEEDFVEVYPMLPGHIDLLMRMTTVLRTRSTRVKGDDYAIRGLLQLLGEMFRQQQLGEQELGALVTLDGIYEIQHTALDVDTQSSLTRVFSDQALAGDELALTAAKAVALLELIQEQTPTTSTLISQCLYARLGQGDREPRIRQALERLCDRGHLTCSEKLGFQLQSSAGQEWQRERDKRAVVSAELSRLVAEILGELAGNLDLPRLVTTTGRRRGKRYRLTAGGVRHCEQLIPKLPVVP